ncbi:MAG TPA: tyrosine-type recombinase/integrase [Candidatus Competibacter sp.]|nr:tyrosine-type recombinase/integrase [Candidatus Competibacter sp.]
MRFETAIANPVIGQWIDHKRYNECRATSTLYHYSLALNRLNSYMVQEQKTELMSATPEQLERYCGLWLYEHKVSVQNRHVIVTAIRGFFAWCAKMRLIAKNPAECLPAPKIGTALPKAARLEHAEKILMVPDLCTFAGLRDAAMLSVLIGTGCRVSGLVGLDEEDLIWTRSDLGTERLLLRLLEKGKKERIIPAPLETGLLLRAYLGHEELEKIDRVNTKGRKVLFVNRANSQVKKYDHYGDSRRLNQAYVDRIIKMYGKKAGLPPRVCHAHAFRHLVGTEMAESDVDLLQRQALLGHADPKSTEVYTHLATRKLMETVDHANPLGKIRTPVSQLADILRTPRS